MRAHPAPVKTLLSSLTDSRPDCPNCGSAVKVFRSVDENADAYMFVCFACSESRALYVH